MGSIYVICSRQCPNGDGIYTLLYALYKYSTYLYHQIMLYQTGEPDRVGKIVKWPMDTCWLLQ